VKGRVIEVESLPEFDGLVSDGATSMRGWRLQDLDLTGRSRVLAGLDASGAVFLGCRLESATEEVLRDHGALVFPAVPDLPFDAYRATLYTPDELYDGLEHGYAATLDATVYAWSRQDEPDVAFSLAQALHDHAIDDALAEYVAGNRIVGVMGGHAVGRGTTAYREAALLGRSLRRTQLDVATGGGPGAMEAANLGAYLSGFDDRVLDDAIALLEEAPSFSPDVDAWARTAFRVRDKWDAGANSLAIPTWYYGHEPPNAFAARIAKFFRNALREDILLRVCSAGIVFLPGAAGTVQEVFQDACENYYADAATVAPMVLVGRHYWTTTVPAWPLLERLAAGRPMERVIHLVDHPGEVVELLA
jgi:predicted Rossmann-fold nucleotide-binding protein